MGKKVTSPIKKAFSKPLRGLANIGTFGTYELARKVPAVRGLEKNIEGALGGGQDSTLVGDFSISPEEVQYNKDLILSEGNTQKDLRSKRRAELADLLAKSQERSFMNEYPNIAEAANSGGLYTGTGFSEALAREKSKLAGETSDILSRQSMEDLNSELGYRDQALARQFSLEDFIRSANVAKATGQALKPQNDGKAGIGAILQGIGSAGRLFVK